ncbi:cache domain-containing protein [Sessilibacter corallicola]|uniref:cache domain-containing protein n=1 Tax=Sessilibacter corallicola TaxID=2904075 RepID=UPI001E3C7398|nr:cache domain-containing protein [Sessilibacter corallicola]MCE2029052.1 cache domain-containing protein [Sessilibacter corallicola]
MLMVLIGSIFGSIYWFTVPLIKDNVFSLELHANRQVLNIVYDLANRMYASTETYVDTTLKSHEQRLGSILNVTENFIETTLDKGRKQGIPEEQIWATIFSELRQFNFGNNDYLWIADYNAQLISHPSDRFHQRDMSDFSDPTGTRIIPDIIQSVKGQGEGFYKYKWSRLDSTDVIDKYSYVRNYPEWNFVIGAGVYIEDIEQEVEAQKQQAILEINKALENVTIAQNGYLFVFDAAGNMLFHPNPNIHGINFKRLLNPVTQNPIYLDLIQAADSGEELYYKWDRPDDQGQYIYEKLSLVRHLSGFDWYISSSVYLDDLKASSVQLSQRIMAMGLLGLIAAIGAAFLFAEWLTTPIKKLSLTAYKISRGNLSAKTGINRNDEIGSLAESFDLMVDRLKDNIDTLNVRVKSRTRELSESNVQLLQAVDSLEKTQTELKIVERRQRMILDALPAQIAYFDSQLNIVFANEKYREVFHQSEGDIQGKALVDVLGQEMYQTICPYIDQAKKGEHPVYEYRLQYQGKEIITRRTLIPFLDDKNEVNGFLTLSIDITHEREAERRMAEASKMKAVGQMSGGLAHDFNNLLSIILGNLMQLQNHYSMDGGQLAYLTPAIRATRRGADMTKRLLAFARKQPLQPSSVKPETLIGELIDLLVAPLPENIRLHTQIHSNVPNVYVDAAQLEDTLVNLVLNSADAMPNGGELRLLVTSIQADSTCILKATFDETVEPGTYVMISVLDEGTGFSEEALSKAYEPFFTTKSVGAGSGLGLSMVYGFVKQSKGYLRIQNRHDNSLGARVDLLLPITTDHTDHKVITESVDNTLTHSSDTNLVLLVEDNADLRKLVRQQLMDSDYSVIEAGNGDEALAMLTGLEQLAGVVSDVVMPGEADGYQVASAVNVCHPQAFIILMTGYTESEPPVDFNISLLHKPFDPQALRRVLPNRMNKNNNGVVYERI